MLLPFIEVGKAAFLVQHSDRATADEVCPMANARGSTWTCAHCLRGAAPSAFT